MTNPEHCWQPDDPFGLLGDDWHKMTDRAYLAESVRAAREEVVAAGEPPDADSEDWIVYRELFNRRALPRVVAAWARLTSLGDYFFPWNTDAVVGLWYFLQQPQRDEGD